MTRPPVLQGIFSLGASIALLTGVKKLLHGKAPDEWLTTIPEQGLSSTYVVQGVIPSFVMKSEEWMGQAPSNELNWPQVISFLIQQMEHLDFRIWLTVLLLCLLGPVFKSLFDKKGKEVPRNNFSHNVATQTEQEPEELVTFQYYHYDPAERALMQFGRSKSESVLFRYAPINFDENESDDFDDVVDRCALPKESSQGCAPFEEPMSEANDSQEADAGQEIQEVISQNVSSSGEDQTSTDDFAKMKVSDQRGQLFTDGSISTATPESRPESFGKSSGSLLSFRGASLERQPSSHSHTAFQLQLSPKKSTNVDVQVNPEQAYSQPFTY